MFAYALAHLTLLSRCPLQVPLHSGLALTVCLTEQIDIAGQLLRRVLHLVLQLLLSRHTCPSSKSGPYRLKVDRRVVGLNHRQGVCRDGDSGIAVEAFEVLLHYIASVDDGVRMRRSIVGLRIYLQVDAVKHRPNSGHHGIELSPLGLHL